MGVSADINSSNSSAMKSKTTCICGTDGVILSTQNRHITAECCDRCTTLETRESRASYAENINLGFIPCGFISAKAKSATIPPTLEEWFSAQLLSRSDSNRSIFLCGPTGSGKTHVAISLLFRFARLGMAIRYIDCPEYIMDRRASYSTKRLDHIGDTFTKKTEKERWSIAHYDVVVLDNIGVGTSNDWTKEQYDILVNSRHTSGKVTFYISNFSDDPARTEDGKNLSSVVGHRPANRINQASVLFLTEKKLTPQPSPTTIFEPVKPPRPLSPNETTFLHIWAREGIFSMVSKKERSTLTAKSKINPNEVIELPHPKPREYISWSGFHVVLQGPVVDYEDANILAALMKIYHCIGEAGTLITSLAHILRVLGLDTDSGAKLKQLKRSLIRLAESRITIRAVHENPKVKSEELMWIGGFLDNITYEGNTKSRKVIIKFNDALAPFYERRSLVMLPLDVLTSLSPYAQGIYRFLLGHRDDHKYISFSRWREILAINESVQDKNFKGSMRLAMKELISRNLLSSESNIDRNGIVHSYVVRSGDESFNAE